MSEAKTFRGILQGKVIVARRIEEDKKFDKHDLVSLYEELLNYFDEYYPKKIVKKQIEINNSEDLFDSGISLKLNVQCCQLFESVLTPQGAEYTMLREFKLLI